jgi:hypothetical protein
MAKQKSRRFRQLVLESLDDRIVPYVLAGTQWANVNVSASFMPDGTITDGGLPSSLFAKLNASYPTALWQREFARALQTWANVSQLNFRFVSDNGAAVGSAGSAQGDSRFGDIRLGAYPRSDSYVAYAYFPSGTTRGGDQFLNTNSNFLIGTPLDLFSVFLHETGHSIGLDHSVSGTIMSPYISGVYTELTADDIAGVQAIYGARKADVYDSAAANNSLATATLLNPNAAGTVAITADITTMTDVDFYRLTVPAASTGKLTVSVNASNFSLLAPKVAVYDSTGGLIASTDVGTAYGTDATLVLDGLIQGQNYFIMAAGATTDVFGMGAYKLNAQFDVPSPPPAISINSVSKQEGNSGTQQYAFTVNLSAVSSNTVTVQYATADITALAGSDYAAASGILSFAPGQTSQTINVIVNGDTDFEPNETFAVNLTNPINGYLAASQGIGTIENDDLPALTIAGFAATEGNSGTKLFTFTVSLSGVSTKTVKVNYATANGTATAGSDYSSTSGKLSFAPGETVKTISVSVNGDTAIEPDETFFINLSSPSNATLGNSQAIGLIIDDDQPPPPLPAVSITGVSALEGDSGSKLFSFAVTLSAASSNLVAVQYATANGTATAGSDYLAASGTLTFAPGETTKFIDIVVNGDTMVEPDETLVVNLSAPTNATLDKAQAIGTIINDDQPSPPPLPTLSINNVQSLEGNSGIKFFVFTVTLSAASSNSVSVQFATANGTATAGSDFAASSGTLTFAPGEIVKTIPISVFGDTEVEADETFFVNLSSAVNAALGVSSGLGRILNDDNFAVSLVDTVLPGGGGGGSAPPGSTVPPPWLSYSAVNVGNYFGWNPIPHWLIEEDMEPTDNQRKSVSF